MPKKLGLDGSQASYQVYEKNTKSLIILATRCDEITLEFVTHYYHEKPRDLLEIFHGNVHVMIHKYKDLTSLTDLSTHSLNSWG